MTSTAANADRAAIRTALNNLYVPGDVIELRIYGTRRGTVSGYYNDFNALARHAAEWNGEGDGVYTTINPVDPDLLARAVNRLIPYAKRTTSDTDIMRRRRLLIDCDPMRPSGISSTDAEHDAALARAREIADWLRSQGWPDLILADSGNGGHLLGRIDLPNDPESAALVSRCLKTLDFIFSDGTVAVDTTTANAGRISKLYGTLASKGDSTSDRPHRLARLLDVPAVCDTVPRELLETLAARLPEEPKAKGRAWSLGTATNGSLDVDAWLATHGIEVRRVGDWNGGRRWILENCQWNADHTNGAAYVVQFPNGAIAAGCHHNSCAGKEWHDLRDVVEPGWRERRSRAGLDGIGASHNGMTPDDIASANESEPVPFPTDALPEALRRLVVEGAAAIGCPADFVALPALALTGGVIGNLQRLQLKPGWEVRSIIWTGTIGDPGTGKTPAMSTARAPLEELQRQAKAEYDAAMEKYRTELAGWERQPKESRTAKPEPPSMRHYYVSDATLEAIQACHQGVPGLVLIRDELVGWVKSHDAYRKAGDRQSWLSSWSGVPIKTDRKTAAPIYIEEPAISVAGGVQPEMLQELAEEAGRRDGFLDRVLWGYPSAEPLTWNEATLNPSTVRAITAAFTQLRTAPKSEAPVRLSDGAKRRFIDWYQDNAEAQEHVVGLARGIYAKFPEQLGRICLVLHCLTYPGDPSGFAVTDATMDDAIDVVEYFRAHAHRVLPWFGSSAPQQEVGLRERVHRQLERVGGDWINQSDIAAKLGGHVPAVDLETVLNSLESDGVAEHRTGGTGPHGGRPPTRWRVKTQERENSENDWETL